MCAHWLPPSARSRPAQVCPLPNVFKPLFGGVGINTWAFVAAELSMGLNLSASGAGTFGAPTKTPAGDAPQVPASAPLPPPKVAVPPGAGVNASAANSSWPGGYDGYGSDKAMAAAADARDGALQVRARGPRPGRARRSWADPGACNPGVGGAGKNQDPFPPLTPAATP
jgi:hypothetical protein